METKTLTFRPNRSFKNLMLTGMVLFTLSQALPTQAQDYGYSTIGRTVTITSYKGPGSSVTIPTTIEGLTVTGIGTNAFYGCSRVSSVAIPNGVTWIGPFAFGSCSGLTNVTIPDSMHAISEWAFSACTNLTSIAIPQSVTNIGGWAFNGCSRLTNMAIPDSITMIRDGVFSDCSSLASISIPSSVTQIGYWSFINCSSLANLSIPHAVTNIANSAFGGCSLLRHVIIPESVTRMEAGAFGGCSSLVSIELPRTLTAIETGVFSSCSSLSTVTIPNSVTNIGREAFGNCKGLSSIPIPVGVIGIENSAFYGCTNLTSVTIPNSVTSFGALVFAGCSGLTSVTIGSGVTNLGASTFGGCSSLRSVYFCGNAPGFGGLLFYGDKNVTVYYLAGTAGWESTFAGFPTRLWNGITKPQILQNPISQDATMGSSATFTATTVGAETKTYQWLKDGKPLANGGRFLGVNSNVLTISSVQTTDRGTYAVVVTNVSGSVTSLNGVLTILVPDTAKPRVTITNPKANMVVSNSVLSIQGTASDNIAVDSVSYRFGSNSWAEASGTTSWTGMITLAPGTNWVQAFATDASGNISLISSNKVVYVPCARMTVTVAGGGSISGTLATKTNASTLFAIGKPVTLKATAATGQTFLGWTGWTSSWTTNIQFAMPASDLVLTSTFVRSPFSSSVFKGLILPNDSFDITNAGAFAVTVTSNGGFSAKFTLMANTGSASGHLGLYAGQTNVAVAQFPIKIGSRSLNASLSFALGSGDVSGSLSAVGSLNPVAQLDGGTVANANLGLFNVAVLSTTTNPPAGNGYGWLTVSNNGVKVNLTLADDKAVITALATDRLKDGTIPVFAALYGNKGILSGWLVASNQQIGSSSLAWCKASGASATFFKAGLNQWVEIQGGAYRPVTNLVQWGKRELIFDDQPLLNGYVDYTNGAYSKAKGTLSIPVSDGQHTPGSWGIAPTTGLVKFSMTNGLTGTGILVPDTAHAPGVYGFTTSLLNKLGSVHSVYSGPALNY